jgi:predicted nucleic acid-binding protein
VDAVFLDTCVLLKAYLCDTLLSVAEAGVYRPLWSDGVLEELRRNLAKAGARPEAIEHRLDQMAAYFPGARITGYEDLTGSMTNHPKDRHVLAAAVAGRADVLVTENLKDFPECATAPFGLVVTGQDAFLLDLLDLYPATVLAALRRQSSRYRREPRTVDDLLTVLARPGNGCAGFARTCRAML